MNQSMEAPVKSHSVSILDRAKATISGVDDVDSFNEQMIVLNTACGAMTIVGESLHVTRLNLEEGHLIIDGRIIAVEYDDRVSPAKKAGLSRLFK